jgi:hypothetical protein
VVARASVLALFAKKAAFLRTPKTSEQTSWWQAMRANWAESILAVLAGGCRLSLRDTMHVLGHAEIGVTMEYRADITRRSDLRRR